METLSKLTRLETTTATGMDASTSRKFYRKHAQRMEFEALWKRLSNLQITIEQYTKEAYASKCYKVKYRTLSDFAKSLGMTSCSLRRMCVGRLPHKEHIPGSGVYFVECDGFIKIGWTKNLGSRIEALQVSNPHEITLLWFDTCLPRVAEKQLHEEFIHMRHSGEWFYDCDKIRRFIDHRRAVTAG